MSSLLKDLQEYNTQDPLMDFADIMFGSGNPQTITQAGLDSDAEKLRLNFDGTKLRLMRGDDELMNWNGISGKDGYQSPEFQNVRDTGPIPEGRYDVRQSEYVPMTLSDALLGVVKKGRFPGSIVSWGTSKVNLLPDRENNMFGRDGFTIHGGWIPGSRGCIDLTRDNDSFMQTFLDIGQDLPLYIRYSNQDKAR